MQYESAEKESSRSLVSLQGLDGKHLVFCCRGEIFVLTSSFIEQPYRHVAWDQVENLDPIFLFVVIP